MEPNPHLVTPTDTRRISREDSSDREDAASSAGAMALPDTESTSSEDTSLSDDEELRKWQELVRELVREEKRKRRGKRRKRRERVRDPVREHITDRLLGNQYFRDRFLREIPIEIRRMDNRSVEIFTNAVEMGTYNSYHIQITFVGHTGAGKTTLTMGLLRRKTEATTSTNGIDISKEQCFYDRLFDHWKAEAPGFNAWSAEDILALAAYYKILEKEVRPGTSTSSKAETSSTNKSHQQTKLGGLRKWMARKFSVLHKGKKQTQCQSPDVDLLKRVVTKNKDIDRGNMFIVPVDFWDFGGQVVFYTSHQAFLSHRSIYILPIDLSLPLHHLLDDNNLDPSDPGARSIKAFLSYWINTLITFANGGLEGQPKIIIVGTKLDKVAKDKQEETVITTIRFIEDEYTDLISSSQLVVDTRLVLDARDVEHPAYGILRQTISDLARNQPYWGEKRPQKWLPVQEKILERKEKGEKICTLDEVRKMNETCMITVQEEELKVILRFMHSLGILLYFNDPGLDDHIILDPQWIANVLKTIITHKSFAQPNQIQAFEQLEKKGTIEREMIDQIWRQPDNEVIRTHQDYLLKALENLDLISTPKSYTEDGKISSLSFYFVPSVLTEEPQKNISCFPKNGTYIRFDFKKFLPLAIYNRLTAACLGTWVVKDDCLFPGLCVFVVDANHSLAIRKADANITACVSHNREIPANKSVCFGIQTFLESTLHRIVSLYQTGATGKQYGGDEKDEVFTLNDKIFEPKREKEEEYCPSPCPGLSDKDLDEPPTLQELSRLSRVLPPYLFLDIGINLGIDEHHRHRIETLRSEQRDQYFELFRCWKNITPVEGCTIRYLLRALSVTKGIYESEHLFCKIHRMSSFVGDKELPTQLRNMVPSDRVLDATAMILSTDYLQVAMELDFEYPKLSVIETNNTRVEHKVRDMLFEWKKSSGYTPTAEILAKALKANACDYKYFCDLMAGKG